MQLKNSRSLHFGLLAFVLLLCTGSLQLVAGEANNTITSEKSIPNSAIVIETQAQHYDEPNIKEYETCHRSRETCLKVCEMHANVDACESECPACPILINHDVLVQGVNDTEYREPATQVGNTTNIIKITNAIHNVIDNTKNVTARNENNIHIHQTNSTTGGKYGLGYNERGPCCNVIRDSHKCRSSRQRRCPQKQQRVCGSRCKARVMYAKRVVTCSGEAAADGSDSCQPSFQYVPYRRRRASTNRCRYQSSWPYVACGAQRRAASSAHCRQCLQLPYGYILHSGVPPRCQSCYGRPAAPRYPAGMWYNMPQDYPGIYGPIMQPNYGGDYDSWEDNFPSNGWNVDKVKCRLADGTLSENCPHEDDDGEVTIEETDVPPTGPKDPLEHLPEPEDDTYYDDDYNDNDGDEYGDDLSGVSSMRRRRHVFHRSAYSHRND